MKRRALTLLLCLTLLLSLAIPGTFAFANATNGDGESPAETPTDSGMVVNKTAEKNADESYTITLEAYATGAKVISEIKNDVPTDIILVLDQSGSMADDMGQAVYTVYSDRRNTVRTSNEFYYSVRHNGGSSNLWYKLDDGSYVSVSVTHQQWYGYTRIDNGKNDSTSGGAVNYWNNSNNLYTYVNGEIKKVVYTRGRDFFWENYNCTYKLEDGTILNKNSNGATFSPTFQNTDDGYLYLLVTDSSKDTYTYTYTDSSGNVITIGTSTGSSTKYTPGFYQRSVSASGGGSRLNALKTAVTTFANQVATKAAGADGKIGTGDDINHRIAVVGFASQSGYGDNTELLSISGRNSGSVGVAYENITDQNLKDVLQSMDESAGRTMVTSAINALAANGATRVDLGMDMANRILNANPIPEGEKRNRVVVVFTDGVPTNYTSFDTSVANSAISYGDTIKNSGATIYSVGIFAGADATSAGNQNGDETQKANWFMQKVSSNNGSVKSPSYYLSATDSGSLNSIFTQIASQIESGGSSSTLTGEAVVKDIVSEQFTLPAGATASSITLETYKYKGGDQKAASSWTKNADAMGAKATVSGDQVSVTGFNFSQNYVGTVTDNGSVSYRGHKLVIKFNVSEKEGLLGGNAIPTNESAGVYEKSDSTDPVISFPKPTVDVPIKDVDVTAEDKNVYLKGTVTAADLQTGATVKVGNVALNLSKAEDTENPYGLEKWQVAYVDIVVKIKDADGNEVTGDYENLTADTTYTVEVTVSPKNEGTVTEKSGKADGNINVFTPTLTYKDSEAYYGEAAATDFSANKVSDEWKHGTTKDTDVTMHGTKPNLDIVYTADDSKLDNGKYTKQDVLVAATVKIDGANVTEQTTFVHQDCTPACDFKATEHPGNPAFKIHIKTCTLNITKQGGAPDESYVFDVYKDGTKYSEVTIEGNGIETLVELPVGTYTIRENTGWSWRYTANEGTGTTLSAKNPTGDITCNNTKNVNTWLNGFSTVVRNIFNQAH